ARAGLFNIRRELWEGGPKRPGGTVFDGVLVDAPCSGIGTWQRNPHARWTTTPKDVEELAVRQIDLLTAAARGVKPGGRLVYSVCTLSRAETTGVAAAFEKACPDFEPLPASLHPGPRDAAIPAHHVWLRPEHQGGNGMFVALWRRTLRPPSSAPAPAAPATEPLPTPTPTPTAEPAP
ncbi:MAG: rRNA cytosine-C5-methylase, partial [Verrucomicrobiales bacterium]|nr:rRNA cytosine-C5-methylase [Verrucomicrobiales bacterium]